MSTDIATRDEAEAAVLAAQEDVLEQDSFQTPILKLGQPLTAEVRAGDAEAGDFINSLTGENLGNAIEFIVSFYQRGRSARDAKTGDYYLAFGDTIPVTWEPLVGEEFVGTPFTEFPDAEEVYRERVNAGDIEWGKGPLVSTTYNYTGHVIVPQVEGDDSPPQMQAVRLSLQRSNKKSADKIGSIKRSLLHGKPFWDKVFLFGTQEDPKSSYGNYILVPKVGRDTNAEEREQAKALALALMGGRVTVKGEEDDPQAGGSSDSEPQAAEGALAV